MRIGLKVRTNGGLPQRGVVLQLGPGSDGNRSVKVFLETGKEVWLPEYSLVIEADSTTASLIDRDEFASRLATVKIEGRLTDTFYSVKASRTNLEHYQFKPVLMFLESPEQRLLLADEVGLGKTIEAGLILSELEARTSVKRALIVCPSRLTSKWQRELASRFDQEFSIMDAKGFGEFLGRYEATDGRAELRCIIGLESIRNEKLLDRILQVRPDFDLTVIDEAHHLRNPGTMQRRAGQILEARSAAYLLLTATPIQLKGDDLYSLLNVMSPGQFDSLQIFKELQATNIHINNAVSLLKRPTSRDFERALHALRNVENESLAPRFTKDITYHNVLRTLIDTPDPTWAHIAGIQRDLRKLNPLSRVISRTTKRDVDVGVVRSPVVYPVELTEPEFRYYQAVLDYTREEYNARNTSQRTPPGFLQVQRERLTASSIQASREYIGGWLAGGSVDVEYEDEDNALDADDFRPDRASPGLAKARLALLEASRDVGEIDTKFQALANALCEIRRQTPDSKVLLFSTFKKTLFYLQRKLMTFDQPLADHLVRMDGDTPINVRPRMAEEFAEKAGFGVMLLSEVGAEGLDFQFCDALINYDLPWNPMKVEQRIGRLDRYGQKAKRIRIYSFVLQDTIEERILQRLYARIKVFEESIGDLAPILGEEIAALEQEIFRSDLSDEQVDQLAEQTLRRIEVLQIEREEFYKNRPRFMQQEMIATDEARRTLDSGKYLTPFELKSVVHSFLAAKYPRTRMEHRSPGVYSIRPSADFKRFLEHEYHKYRSTTDSDRQFLRAAMNSYPIPVTFDGEVARERRAINFINVRHPLVKAAIEYRAKNFDNSPASELAVITLESPDPDLSGDYAFFIWSIESRGGDIRRELAVVAVDEDGHPIEQLEQQLLSMLAGQLGESEAMPGTTRKGDAEKITLWSDVQDRAHLRFDEIRRNLEKRIRQENDSLIRARETALTNTYNGRLSKFRDWLEEAKDPRIRRLQEGQIRNTEVELQERLAELNRRRDVVVSGELKIAGILSVNHVVRPQSQSKPSEDVLRTNLYALSDQDTANIAEPTSDQNEKRGEPAPVITANSSGVRNGHLDSQGEAASQGDTGIRIAEDLGLRVIDRRPKGGLLWIVDPQRRAYRLEPLGFRYASNGGRATGNVGAWYLQSRSDESNWTLRGVSRKVKDLVKRSKK